MSTDAKPAYSPGLEGVIAGESAICEVNANAGLLYRGYDIHELATATSFEHIVYLLLHGELPDATQLKSIQKELAEQSALPDAVTNILRLLPKNALAMDVLRTGVSAAASFDPELADNSHDANVRKAVRIIARMSTIVTTGWRVAHGQEPVSGGKELSHTARFLLQLFGKPPQDWQTRAMDIIFALYAEHDFNASTFASRVTASTLSDIYSGVVSAIGTLKGALHGGANEEAMKMLEDVGSADRAEAWLKERLARKEKIMGFGHRVYKTGDSRVPVMRELTRELGERTGQTRWVAICEKLEEVMAAEKKLYSNLDLYAAPVLKMMGIPVELNTPLFAASRVSGWCAHVIEQHDHNRIIRPRSLYTGPAPRKMADKPA